MKNIKLIISVFLLSASFVACDSEFTDPVVGSVTSAEQVEVSFSDTNNNAIVLEDGGKSSVDISINKPLPYDVKIELEVTSSDGSLVNNVGVAELNFESLLTIPAGTTSVSTTLLFIDDDKIDPVEVYTVRIKNAFTSKPSAEYFFTNFDASKQSRTIKVYDSLPNIITTTPGEVKIDLKWTDSSRDMDFYMYNAFKVDNSNEVDKSIGVTTTESVTLSEDANDLAYYFYIVQYDFTADVNYTIDYTFPDGQVLNLSDTVTKSGFAQSIDKITDGDTVTYTIIKL